MSRMRPRDQTQVNMLLATATVAEATDATAMALIQQKAAKKVCEIGSGCLVILPILRLTVPMRRVCVILRFKLMSGSLHGGDSALQRFSF